MDRFNPLCKSKIGRKANIQSDRLTKELIPLEEDGMVKAVDGKLIDNKIAKPYILTDKGAEFRESLKQYVE